jgi:hypothetical protein
MITILTMVSVLGSVVGGLVLMIYLAVRPKNEDKAED